MLSVQHQSFQYYTPGVSESAILARVRNFVGGNFHYMQLISMPGDDDRFFGNAALSPNYVAVIVNFIEEEFGAIVSPCEINEENLGSLRAVARFVASKQPFAVG